MVSFPLCLPLTAPHPSHFDQSYPEKSRFPHPVTASKGNGNSGRGDSDRVFTLHQIGERRAAGDSEGQQGEKPVWREVDFASQIKCFVHFSGG